MKVSLSAEASLDAQDAADWYIDQNAWPAALDLQMEIDQTLTLLSRGPGLGTPGPHGTRSFPIHRFPVSVIYRIEVDGESDVLRVIALAAQRRQPGYWVGRR